ncbi:hypothetical protein D039_2810 [Vibrio parahaemolyticus EKP-028]|nr:hypothetical protein D039_2810 [Vibrio parahaemolyticus EKP-028]
MISGFVANVVAIACSKVCALETSGISKPKHAILILLSFTKISPNNLTPVIFQK